MSVMRCPKCSYIGFDSKDRCRNCGYYPAFSIKKSKDSDSKFLKKSGKTDQFADFFIDHVALNEREGAREISSPVSNRKRISKSRLSTRRSTPELTKFRSPLATAKVEKIDEPKLMFESVIEEVSDKGCDGVDLKEFELAGALRRIGAALLDAILLITIDLVVVYFTMKLCGLTIDTAGLLPVAPLVLFFCLLNGGYLMVFTIFGGQTVGKMLMGIRVVGIKRSLVEPRLAALRTVLYVVSALPVGIGFLVSLFGHEQRAFHDHLAATKVVKNS